MGVSPEKEIIQYYSIRCSQQIQETELISVVNRLETIVLLYFVYDYII